MDFFKPKPTILFALIIISTFLNMVYANPIINSLQEKYLKNTPANLNKNGLSIKKRRYDSKRFAIGKSKRSDQNRTMNYHTLADFKKSRFYTVQLKDSSKGQKQKNPINTVIIEDKNKHYKVIEVRDNNKFAITDCTHSHSKTILPKCTTISPHTCNFIKDNRKFLEKDFSICSKNSRHFTNLSLALKYDSELERANAYNLDHHLGLDGESEQMASNLKKYLDQKKGKVGKKLFSEYTEKLILCERYKNILERMSEKISRKEYPWKSESSSIFDTFWPPKGKGSKK